MSTPILATKLYIPPPRPKVVARPRLSARLNEGLSAECKLTLISAPAGFGKTTLVSEWLAGVGGGRHGRPPPLPIAWLSLDAGDSDPARFLTHLVAALQTIAAGIGAGGLAALESPQPPATEALLTVLLNEIAALRQEFILVLDDYHLVEAKAVDQALTFLLEHQPPPMHLVIATREDPSLPLARLRARGQLTELRAADLRFTLAEAADFLKQVMGLNLSTENIAALEARTEGWIAGLQLAALSMQGHASQDVTSFIKSFTGSHHFVLDYLVEEVLGQQSASVQTFLLRTSILDRMCGPLCDAVMDERRKPKDEGAGDASVSSSVLRPSAAVLEYLERANLFIVPLDDERRWYRYHHLFGDLLRKRLGQSLASGEIAGLHIRASEWYEHHHLAFEAFQHAVAANDVERAERLLGSKTMALHFRSVAMPILDWLASLPKTVLDARPQLWVRSATLALMAGQTTGVEERLQAAEHALQGVEPDEKIRDLIGQIACTRATLAFTHYDPEAMITQAHRALEYLHPDDLTFLFTANWVLTTALGFKGDRVAAARACQESLAISQRSGEVFSRLLATHGWGTIQELDNQLHQAAETYQQVLALSGEHPLPHTAETHLGLARIYYEWNDLVAAEQHGQQSLQLARLYDRVIDRFIISEVFLARLSLARGDVDGAAAMLVQIEQTARQQNFILRLPEIAAVQALVQVRQGNVAAAACLVQTHDLPISQARVYLAQGEPSKALAVLAPLRQQMEARGWQDERLKVMILQAVALHAHGEKDKAVQLLGEALALAEPDGFIRLFVDEGPPMAQLLSEAAARGLMRDYIAKLLAAFPDMTKAQGPTAKVVSAIVRPPSFVEPLSQREVEILKLITHGLSNREIGARLFLALDTVKGHNRRIFDKLQVESRTEAIARARELGLL